MWPTAVTSPRVTKRKGKLLWQDRENREHILSTFDVYVEQYAHIVSHLSDFDGDTQKWKNAVYDLFRWNMTYSYAYKINVNESRKNGVFVCIYCRPKFEEPLLETMEDL